MSVRDFGATGRVTTSIGSLAAIANGAWTWGYMVQKTGGDSAYHVLSSLETGDLEILAHYINDGSGISSETNGESGEEVGFGTGVSGTTWYVVFIEKASGTSTPRGHVYSYSTDSWSHTNMNGTMNDVATTANNVELGYSGEFGYASITASKRLAIAAVWNSILGNDAFFESQGFELAASNWNSLSPLEGWLFNQASTATAVDSFTGGGANQTATSNTTVVNGDDPPGFDFSLSGAQDLEVPFHQATTSFFPLTIQNQNPEVVSPDLLGPNTQLFAPTLLNQDALIAAPARLESTVQLFAPTLTITDQDLNIPLLESTVQLFTPSVLNEGDQAISPALLTNISQLFSPTLVNGTPLELSITFKTSSAQVFTCTISNEGDDMFEPTLVGNGSLVDQIWNGLISQGFLTGSIADREYNRLLAKLGLVYTGEFTLSDLYSMADEPNRLEGLLETA